MYANVSREFAKAYYHWFFLLRPEPIPETLIGANPDFYLESHMGTRHGGLKVFAFSVAHGKNFAGSPGHPAASGTRTIPGLRAPSGS